MCGLRRLDVLEMEENSVINNQTNLEKKNNSLLSEDAPMRSGYTIRWSQEGRDSVTTGSRIYSSLDEVITDLSMRC